MAVDWGWFWFLTQPFFWLLDNLYKLLGNFGLAILLPDRGREAASSSRSPMRPFTLHEQDEEGPAARWKR